MLTPDRIKQIREKAGITKVGVVNSTNSEGRISELRKNSGYSGIQKYVVPPKAETLNERLAKANANAEKYQKEADKYKGFGFYKQLGKEVASNIVGSEIGLGKTITAELTDPRVYADNVAKTSATLVKLKKIIDTKEKEGKDVTALKRHYNSQVDFIKEQKNAIGEFEKTIPTTGEVVGQLGGTALDVFTAGTYGKAAQGAKSFKLLPKATNAVEKTAVSVGLPELSKVAPTTATGLFTKQGATNVLKGAGIGYGYDVSSGLQGFRGEDRTGGKAFIPGLGTAIGGGIPAVIEGGTSVKNRFGEEGRKTAVVKANKKSLEKLVGDNSVLRRVTKKHSQRGIDSVDLLSQTDLLRNTVDDSGVIRAQNAIDELNDFIKPQEDVISKNLAKEGKKLPLSFVEKELKKNITNSGLEGEALDNALNKVAKEIKGLGIRADKDGYITLSKIHDAKVNKYATIDYLSEAAKKADKSIAKTFKELVEKNTKSVDVKALNNELAQHFAVLDLLEKLNGKKVNRGRLGKYFAQTFGGIVGSHFGPLGTIIGGELGGRVNTIAMKSNFSGTTGKSLSTSEAMQKAIEQGKENPVIELPQSNFGNRNINQLTQSKPIINAIDTSVLPKKLDVNRYISDHFQEASDVLNSLSPEEINNLGGVSSLLSRTKTNIVDGLKAYGQDAIAEKIDNVPLSGINSIFDFQDKIGQVLSGANTTKSNVLKETIATIKSLPKNKGFIASEPYKETGDLTTKILKDLEGKTTVSKQYILDATNRGELKQVERDLIRDIVSKEGDTINVADFAKKVKAELLPLKVKSTSNPKGSDPYKFRELTLGDAQYNGARMQPRYEMVNLPDELRGNVANYRENIYESPIKTSAGQVHFGGKTDNYFGHTRIEDMADNKTRRVIEVQSDLYQKGNLEREGKMGGEFSEFNRLVEKKNYFEGLIENPPKIETDYNPNFVKETQKELDIVNRNLKKYEAEYKARQAEVAKLQQYNDPTAHFRMIREEIKKAAEDGKTKLQFPTGETAMKIEGLGSRNNWVLYDEFGENLDLTEDLLQVGKEVKDGASHWIITDVLGDGKFKAVPKEPFKNAKLIEGVLQDNIYSNTGKKSFEPIPEHAKETFDISGKVDTNNPIYKFYEKDVQKYLNKFGGKRVIDDKGVSWIEVPIKKEYGSQPVDAFGKIKKNPLLIGAGVTGIGAIGANVYNKIKDNE